MESLDEFLKRYNTIYCYGMGKCLHDFKVYCKRKKLRIDLRGYMVSDANSIPLSRTGRKVYTYSSEMVTAETGIIVTLYNTQYIEDVLRIIGDEFKEHVFILLQDRRYAFWFRKRYLGVAKTRRLRSIFDYRFLSKEIPYSFMKNERQWSTVAYGLFQCLKKRVRIPYSYLKNSTIDHGIRMPYNRLFSPEDLNPPNGNVFTVTKYLWDNQKHVNVYSMKPPIKYVKSIFSYGKMSRMKRNLGKTLLVMPMHTVEGTDLIYDESKFLGEIEKIRNEFRYNSVIVSLHYEDIKKKADIPYKKKGYKIVTSGHGNDAFFLFRQRTIFLLCDLVMANGLGTFLPYAIALNRPVYIYNQEYATKNVKENLEKYTQKSFDYEMAREMKKAEDKIMEYFAVYNERITEDQRKIIIKICGSLDRTEVRQIR